ncbi:MAG: DUF1295 domain-containing protein [Gammaproteobacteria bacterium]|nr:DUF1295 domain-containing protein [Gammaproteobacteria bacterium]
MKEKHFIDTHKGINFLAILGVMGWYGNWDNTTLWVYLALHGTYGFLWIMKSRWFGDASWERETGIAYGLVIWGGLSLYWITPVWIAHFDVDAPNWYLAMCIGIYALGVFFHFAADMQKHMHLKHARGTLLTDGLWGLSRNPNYFGELLIYGGFTLLAMHWLPMLVLVTFIGAIWVPNMVRKDRSLSRYPEFAAYRRKTRWLIPYVF